MVAEESAVPHEAPPVASSADREAAGKAARTSLPRSRLGGWAPAADRRSPLEILEEQERSRLPDLVPIRHGRMAASPFAFFRGAAGVMASDLAPVPRTHLGVQLCGDAHLVNFGGFASPERDLIFDVNDFDETSRGPFEWDLARLAASIEVAGRDRGMDEPLRRDAVLCAGRSYRTSIREFAGMRMLDVWYSRLDAAGVQRRWGKEAGTQIVRNMQRMTAKAQTKDHLKAFGKLVRVVDGEVRFASDPPLLMPASEFYPGAEADRMHDFIAKATAALPPLAARRPAVTVRPLPLRGPGPQGCRGGQRRHAVLGRPAPRPGR